MNRHWYRQQVTANLFLPTAHFHGEHHLKFGVDVERESFHQQVERHDYEVLRDDGSVARLVSFEGDPFQHRKNLEAAQYVQDHWMPLEGLTLEGGVRTEWNEVVRDLEVAPRVAVAWAPKALHGTKISAGWGVYYDAISLGTLARDQGQTSLSTFFLPDGTVVRSGADVIHGDRPDAFDAEIPDGKPDGGTQAAVRFLRQGGLHVAGRRERIRIRNHHAAKRTDVLRWRRVPTAQFAARTLRRGGFLGAADLCRPVRMVPGIHAVELAL